MPKVRARTHFAVGRRIVRPGDLYNDTDPVVAGRERLFTPVEQATAAPGETRDLPQEPCPVDGCDYEGSALGMKIHTARAH